jgi:hypothetical protein
VDRAGDRSVLGQLGRLADVDEAGIERFGGAGLDVALHAAEGYDAPATGRAPA